VRRALLPLLPSELASAVLTAGIAFAYVELGLPALALFGVVVLIRGGDFIDGIDAGAFAVSASNRPSDSFNRLGFRGAR
jgi:hypothetical protein